MKHFKSLTFTANNDLDAGDANLYSLIVVVSDGAHSSSATVLVSVTSINDFDPVISNSGNLAAVSLGNLVEQKTAKSEI